MTVLVNMIVTLGMIYVVPVGLRLIDPAGLRRTARLWPLLPAPGALCRWLPRGAPAACLAALYAAASLALAARAPARPLPRDRRPGPAEVAVATALASPLCSVLAWRRLTADRLEMTP
ncbi:YndJ family transporter [Streptomyces sp. NPDC058655]|uniref:YndJ family transporter n=1 Tax=unclassified Streptomyces TaxID=2593676 RepID=UPI003651C7CC